MEADTVQMSRRSYCAEIDNISSGTWKTERESDIGFGWIGTVCKR